MKLTATNIRTAAIPAGKSEAIFFDEDVPGFGLRVREQGSRTFIFQYKLGTKQARMSLVAASALNIGDARKTAENLHARVKLGHDPANEKSDARVKAAQTFAATVTQFLDTLRPRYRPRAFAGDRAAPDQERRRPRQDAGGEDHSPRRCQRP